MADISDIFLLIDNPNEMPLFLVRSTIHLAELGEAIEDHLHELHQVPNKGASAARYARELKEGAERLCKEYGTNLIMPHFKTELGEERFSLYFREN